MYKIVKKNLPWARDASASRAPALVSQPSSPSWFVFVIVFFVVVVELVVVVDKGKTRLATSRFSFELR